MQFFAMTRVYKSIPAKRGGLSGGAGLSETIRSFDYANAPLRMTRGGVSADVMLSVVEASACKVVIVSVAPF